MGRGLEEHKVIKQNKDAVLRQAPVRPPQPKELRQLCFLGNRRQRFLL